MSLEPADISPGDASPGVPFISQTVRRCGSWLFHMYILAVSGEP